LTIVELLNTLEVGGAERMVVNLALECQARGHRLHVVCLRSAGPLAQPLIEAGIPVTEINKGEGFSWAAVKQLAGILSREKADVVHTHNPLVHHYGVAAAKLAGTAVIVNTIHGIHNIQNIGPGELLYGASTALSAAVVTVCRAAEQFFSNVKVIQKSRIRMIYNGIPLDSFLALDPPRANSAGKIRFGAIGRLVDVKDHRTLLRAFALLAARHSNVELQILGGGPLEGELTALRDQLNLRGVAELRGESLDVAGFLRDTHVFVHSSLTEALPMTLLEAMAAARPVVVTAVGGLPEIVTASNCGWLCPPANAEALAQSMETALGERDRIAERGLRGRAFVHQHCSVEKMAQSYIELFTASRERRQ